MTDNRGQQSSPCLFLGVASCLFSFLLPRTGAWSYTVYGPEPLKLRLASCEPRAAKGDATRPSPCPRSRSRPSQMASSLRSQIAALSHALASPLSLSHPCGRPSICLSLSASLALTVAPALLRTNQLTKWTAEYVWFVWRAGQYSALYVHPTVGVKEHSHSFNLAILWRRR
jgi:hypothetical protein